MSPHTGLQQAASCHDCYELSVSVSEVTARAWLPALLLLLPLCVVGCCW